MSNKWRLRFEFDVAHRILSTTLAPSYKLPLSHLTKTLKLMTISHFQNQFSMSKINQITPIFSSLKNIELGKRFLLMTHFWNNLFSKNGPIVWYQSACRIYENDFRVIFDWRSKLYIGFDVQREIQILKGI